MGILIKNGYVIDIEENSVKKRDVLIEGELIKKIEENINFKEHEIIDATGLYILPGLVDMHAHFREPGYEYKETIKTGSLAAASGGYTTVFIMPNTKPCIDNVQNLIRLKNIIDRDSIINVYPIGAVSIGQKGKKLTDIKELYKNGVYGISDDGQPIMSEVLMEEAMKKANKIGIPIMTHSEDKEIVGNGCINKGKVSKELGISGISRDAENEMIKRDLKLAKRLNLKLHVCHVSTKEAINMIREAKKQGVHVTCEVTPHHFSITEDVIRDKGTIGKVNPPLRTKEDIVEIIKGLKDGTIDAIATDHAPHSKEDKELDIQKAPFGISGIEIAFSLAVTYLIKKEHLDIVDIVKLMSYNPSKIMRIDKGMIKEGSIADIAIVDLNNQYVVTESNMYSKGKNTPFLGTKLSGTVNYTIASGNIVYRR
ncbi:dihydroorotase [Caldisalinibacter kiritimatiensis]|uniref:Dihydroorotase n=1 Tax=Caldisalinibacter kiritimatiensis TaxID=1304284 RepID=R1CXE7_9FIRM|nr:dihydroorotase [Caldisalinibacter kiritimatiensis]EOD01299.1 Dihydroorotase [Caldisalinibacter kiritimatiensis]